jgi:hypothetical protein
MDGLDDSSARGLKACSGQTYIILLRRIGLTCKLQDDAGTAWMLWKEASHIPDIAV